MGKARETILRLLSDGKITIEEAEELLDAISAKNHIGNDFFGKMGKNAFKPEPKTSGHGFKFDFHFPWDDPGWKWPWEEAGWQWPWNVAHQSDEHEGPTEIIHHVEDGASLVVKCDDGNLTVGQGDNGEIVKVYSSNEEISSEISDDHRTVYVSSDDNDVSISIPSRVASIQISNGDGNVKIGGVKSDITLKMDDGNVMISGVEGKIFASIDDGNIVVYDSISKEIAVRAGDGSVSLNMVPPINEGLFNLKIDDGRLSVFLPTDCACKVTADVEDGLIHHNFADIQAEILEEDEGHLSASLNGGGAEFILSAEDGEIVIRAGN